MKKSRFIVGSIFFVLSVAACAFGSYLLYDATTLEGTGAIAGIVLIPVALISYAFQFLTCLGAEISLWTNYKKGDFCKTAGMILAIICLVFLAVSVAYFAYLSLRS